MNRNNFPFDTKFEKTLNRGPGYAIFVIGPDQQLYTGSHINGVFHHSSFLGESAVFSAGELKTNPDGTVTELSGKSGHYRPTHKENLYTLQYFRDRGVDLTNMKFTYFNSQGKTFERNAQEYLSELEHQQSLDSLSSNLFT